MNLSVIIPTYNHAATILDCLDSVRSQFSGELLVVDGGSQDTTTERSLEAGARIWHGPRDLLARCRLGAQKSHGDWLLFMAADQKLPKGWFERFCGLPRSPYLQGGTFVLERGVFAQFRARYSNLGNESNCVFVTRAFFDKSFSPFTLSDNPWRLLTQKLKQQHEFVVL